MGSEKKKSKLKTMQTAVSQATNSALEVIMRENSFITLIFESL